MPSKPRDPIERLLLRIEIIGDCWEWQGATWAGYGKINVPGRSPQFVHRLLYETAIGPVPEGLDLDHLCRNRLCVNPGHLEPVTRRENLLRGDTIPARKAAQTHCIRGHEFDEANTIRRPNGTRCCRSCKRSREGRRTR